MPASPIACSRISIFGRRPIGPASAAAIGGSGRHRAGLSEPALQRRGGDGDAGCRGLDVVLPFLFRSGTWVNLTAPLLAMAGALFAGTAYRYFVEDREKRKVKRLFGRYVSKDVYSQLIAHPELAELGGRRRDMTVLFSDIRGFTSVTEKGIPEELVAQLNEYFTRMVDIVFRHHGTVDKFVGDMVMALFSAPLDDADHADMRSPRPLRWFASWAS